MPFYHITKAIIESAADDVSAKSGNITVTIENDIKEYFDTAQKIMLAPVWCDHDKKSFELEVPDSDGETYYLKFQQG